MNTVTDPIAAMLGAWSAQLTWGSVLLRLMITIIFGTIIGCERATKRHAAGLRTFILVSLASAIAMMLDQFVMEDGGGLPMLSAATVVGIAIISSNSILYSSKNQIKGLTTSVALWTCGIVGLTVGAGMYCVSLFGFLALLCCISQFPSFEIYLKNRSNHFEIHVELKNKSNLQDFITTLRALGLKIDDIEVNPAYLGSGLSVYSISLTVARRDAQKYKNHQEMIQALKTLEYVYYAEEIQ